MASQSGPLEDGGRHSPDREQSAARADDDEVSVRHLHAFVRSWKILSANLMEGPGLAVEPKPFQRATIEVAMRAFESDKGPDDSLLPMMWVGARRLSLPELSNACLRIEQRRCGSSMSALT